MGKGIHISTLLYLIIAAIVLILFAPMLIRSAGAVWDQLLTSLGFVSPSTPLEQAIKCAYLRCTAGCLDSKLEKITWEEDGKTVNCMTEFCGAGIKHVCEGDSIKNPVEVKISSPQEISYDRLKIEGNNIFDCITDNGAGIWNEQRFKILSFSVKDIVSAERDGQCGSWGTERNKYKTVKLKAGEYFVTFPQNFVWGVYPLLWDQKHVRIMSFSTYLSERFTSKESCEGNGFKWCSMCNLQEHINKFRRSICVPPDEDCGYTDVGNCLCHTEKEKCEKDEECKWYWFEGIRLCLKRQ